MTCALTISLRLSSLKISEKQLHELAKEQESNAQSIVDLVNENEEILDGLKASFTQI